MITTHATPTYAVISDETGTQLDDCIAFCLEEGLDQIEVRQVDGVAPLSLNADQLGDAHRRIAAAGLTVAGIATPLLKWAAPGRATTEVGDQFGFERDGLSDDELIIAAIRVADAFETRNLRIFSYLKHEGYAFDHLKPALDNLLDFAERYDKVLLLENEPVCNIARMDQLADVVVYYDTLRLQALPDIGNSAHIGEFPTRDLIRRLMPYVSHLHFKDYSEAAGRFVPLGTGDVELDQFLETVFERAGGRRLTFSLETHCPDDRLGATRASFRHLRDRVEHTIRMNSAE